MAHRTVEPRDLRAARTAASGQPMAEVAGLVMRAIGLLGLWYERARQRRQLSELPPHLLRDIGIDRVDALREARKPFWRP
jgi:uncharacterized protein YjiS (DUF1127 family)